MDHNQCDAILADRRVRAVKFTGSTAGGKIVAVSAAKHVKKGSFELGGNDAFIVLKEANLDKAVDAAFLSRIRNGGQQCNAAKRFIVTEPVYDKFKEMLIEKIKRSVVIGDPMDRSVNMGPLVTEHQLDVLKNQVKRAMTEGGAKHIHGDLDIRASRPDLADGNYTDSIVLEGMDTDSAIYQEEFFGPVFNLFKVANSKDAVDLANHTEYGLSATVFSEDLAKARVCA